MSSVVVYLPPPMRKRSFYMMIARAKEVQEDGEDVILAYCALKAGTCSNNLAGSRLVCTGCRMSSRLTAKASGLPFVELGAEPTGENDESESERLTYEDASEIALGVQSCLVTHLRVMTADLNRVPELRDVKRRYFAAAALLLRAFMQLMKRNEVSRVEVLNGRFSCAKVGIMAANASGAGFNTLDFNAYGRPMLFPGYTPHDRIAVQERIRRNIADREVAAEYFASRRDRSFNKYAAAHKRFEPSRNAEQYRRKVTFFLSSQDECESLGPSWRSPFRNNVSVIREACQRFPDHFFTVRFHPNQSSIVGDVIGPYQSLQLDNLQLFYPEDDVDSYQLMEWSDVVVTFASTIAIEACWTGKPVIELGPSYFDHLGISYTPQNTAEFLNLLQTDLQPQSAEAAARFANYELNDYDSLRYLRHGARRNLKLVGVRRRGVLFAKSAKEINKLATFALQRVSQRLLSTTSKSALTRVSVNQGSRNGASLSQPTEKKNRANMSPIIITGCPRSGSLMMGRVFANLLDDFCLITEHQDKHSDIPEDQSGVEDHRLWWEHFDYQAWNSVRQRPRVDVPLSNADSIDRIRQRYLEVADGRRIVIKNPSHILYPDLIRCVFPDAQFVYCARSPWATLQSMIRNGRDSFVLRTPRLEGQNGSLLLQAAVGWHDAMDAYFQFRDQGWVVAQYERIVESPREEISEICRGLGINPGRRFEEAVKIPQPSPNSNYYFVKQAFRRSPEKDKILQELRAGCEHFGYPLSPDDLEGTLVANLVQKAVKGVRKIAG
ncbi:MAG TPA: hypothetical protein EYQ63_06020 [Fuerstia sp.]|nr:hypothetical protein [Fuerstiella sp.]